MRAPTTTGRSILRPGALLLALAAWGVLAPTGAKAGCRHPGLAESGAMAWLDALDPPDDGATPAPAPAPPPRRCDGPSCSEREAAPPAPASTTFEPGQRWALGSTPIPDPGSDPGFAPPADARPRPVRNPLAIFHPPRLPRALATA